MQVESLSLQSSSGDVKRLTDSKLLPLTAPFCSSSVCFLCRSVGTEVIVLTFVVQTALTVNPMLPALTVVNGMIPGLTLKWDDARLNIEMG